MRSILMILWTFQRHVKFATTATSVHVQFTMKAVENGDWLWAINGHSGVDFYVQDSSTHSNSTQGVQWRWATASGKGSFIDITVFIIESNVYL